MTTTPSPERTPAIEVTLNAERLFAGLRGSSEDGEGYDLPLAEEILERAALQLLQRLAADKDYYTPLRDKTRQIRDEEIRAAIAPLVAEALTGSIQPTDAYGSPKGAPLTLREIVVKEAEKYLRTPDNNYGSGVTPVQKFIREEVERAFRTELTKTIAAAKAEVLAAVKENAAGVITKTITDLAGIR